ncbi:MAG: ribosome-associated translation inhibitor RaiA [Flavobacteriales bacterium]|nr:ribosome-associated translation inhibitor RaiA [Flavobacteriales bacterium]MCC6939723.1 ribosome-associated translation inhibitor RaiA [Flavobacteriales bacterium]
MNVIISSLHFDADQKLTDHIKEKISKLNQFHDGIHAAEVILRLEHDGENRENKVVEIKLAVPGVELFAKRNSRTFEEATTDTVEALRNQIQRSKERAR